MSDLFFENSFWEVFNAIETFFYAFRLIRVSV